MYRTKRQSRYKKLRDNGFLPFEASVLSRVPLNVPYMKPLVAERRKLVKKQLDKKVSQTKIADGIKLSYNVKGFTRRDSIGRKLYDVWAYLRKYEDNWRDKQPEYRSPSQKRRKNFTQFKRKFENRNKDIQLK